MPALTSRQTDVLHDNAFSLSVKARSTTGRGFTAWLC